MGGAGRSLGRDGASAGAELLVCALLSPARSSPRPAWLSAASPGSRALSGGEGASLKRLHQSAGRGSESPPGLRVLGDPAFEPDPRTRDSALARAPSGPLLASPGARGELWAFEVQSLETRALFCARGLLFPGAPSSSLGDSSTRAMPRKWREYLRNRGSGVGSGGWGEELAPTWHPAARLLARMAASGPLPARASGDI